MKTFLFQHKSTIIDSFVCNKCVSGTTGGDNLQEAVSSDRLKEHEARWTETDQIKLNQREFGFCSSTTDDGGAAQLSAVLLEAVQGQAHIHQPECAAHAEKRGKSALHTRVGAHGACIKSTQRGRKEMKVTHNSLGSTQSCHKNMLCATHDCRAGRAHKAAGVFRAAGVQRFTNE